MDLIRREIKNSFSIRVREEIIVKMQFLLKLRPFFASMIDVYIDD